MSGIPRRTIAELCQRYQLEPNLRDIYVEGEFDVGLIEWFLTACHVENAVVYDINTVDIPEERVLNAGLSPGSNRDRVITLAAILGTTVVDSRVACIADRDFDLVMRRDHQLTGLLLTDYTGMEMYLFNETVVGKFLTIVLLGFPLSAARVLEEIAPVLQEFFVIRLANQELGLGMTWMNPERCCSVSKRGNLTFDSSKFIKRYLEANGSVISLERFAHQIEILRDQLLGDVRCQIRGHDFIELLAWYTAKCLNRGISGDHQVLVGRGLSACLEVQQAIGEPLFANLLSRLQYSQTVA